MSLYTRLGSSTASFEEMMERFGVVTVMNADVYKVSDYSMLEEMNAYEILQYAENVKSISLLDEDLDDENITYLCTLDTLKTANVSIEGPDKTITGGRYNNTLLKFGKSATIEMQDALGNYKALDALCGTVSEYTSGLGTDLVGLHNTEDFAGPKMIIGDSFFIDQKTGEQVKVKIMFYQFLPESLFNLTQDAEGDATIFDMNGDLLTTEIMVGKTDGNPEKHGVFWSIIDATLANATIEDVTSSKYMTYVDTGDSMEITPQDGYELRINGVKYEAVTLNSDEGTTTVDVYNAGNIKVYSKTFNGSIKHNA